MHAWHTPRGRHIQRNPPDTAASAACPSVHGTTCQRRRGQIVHPAGNVGGAGPACARASASSRAVLISSQYHRGRNPTRSSPFSTSRMPVASSSSTLTPAPGTNLTRHTRGPSFHAPGLAGGLDPEASLASAPLPESRGATVVVVARFRRNSNTWCPQSRETSGSQAPGLPRTRRGSWIVLNGCTVVSAPAGVRNPTTISYR